MVKGKDIIVDKSMAIRANFDDISLCICSAILAPSYSMEIATAFPMTKATRISSLLP